MQGNQIAYSVLYHVTKDYVTWYQWRNLGPGMARSKKGLTFFKKLREKKFAKKKVFQLECIDID